LYIASCVGATAQLRELVVELHDRPRRVLAMSNVRAL
jgi:hypothetical protein